MADDGIVERAIVEITVNDKALEELPAKMGKVTARMNQYLTLTSGVAERTGDQWTKTAADMLKSTMNIGEAVKLLSDQLKTQIPNGVKAVDVAIKIMDKTLVQTMTSMIKHNVPMDEMERSFKRLGARSEDFTRILGIAQEQLSKTPQVIAPAIEGVKELGEAMSEISPERLFVAKGKGLVSTISQMYEMGMSTEEVAQAFADIGRTGRDVQVAMVKVNDDVDATTEAFEKLEPAIRKTDWSAKGIAASLEWAAYRFLFSLAVYMGFRKVLRMVNEAIAESIRLHREYTQAQQTLRASLEVNNQLLTEQVGTLKEWNDFIKRSSESLGGGQIMWTKATATALEFNATMGKSQEELENLITLGMAVAQMWQLYDGEQLDVVRGTQVVMDAIRGQESAMTKLTITEEDVAASIRKTVEQFHQLPDAMQESVRWAYIVTERYDTIGKAAIDSATDQEGSASRVLAANEALMVSWGGLWTNLVEIGRIARLVAFGPLIWLTNALDNVNAAIERSGKATGEWFRVNKYLGQFATSFQILGAAVDRFAPSWLKASKAVAEVGVAVKETAQKTLDAAVAWLIFVGAADRAKETAAKMKRIFDAVMGIQQKAAQAVADAAEAAAEAWDNLGNAIADAIRESDKAITQAGADYLKDYNETFEDQKKDELKLEERYADKADDLRKRAADKIADLRKRATEEEENDRADLNLRLHQMEEDHLLSMRQLRDQYQMNLEDAARTRDAVAIRRLQRQYGLEKKQREETYQLQQHQTVESWEARRQETKDELENEIKEVQDNLAEELAELRAERKDELAEIRQNWEDRRTELTNQYNQELADLKAALETRLAEAITEWANQNNIPLEAAKAAVTAMAEQYDLDSANIMAKVAKDLPWLEAQRAAWEAINLAAAGMPTSPIMKPTTLGTKTVGFAEGGMALATAPTMVKVGEAGPELFGAMPLNKLGGMGGGAMGMRGGMDIRLTIDGTQSGAWSGDFETQVLRVFRGLLQESM